MTVDEALVAIDYYANSPRCMTPAGEEAKLLGCLTQIRILLPQKDWPELMLRLGSKLSGPEDIKFPDKLTAVLRARRGIPEPKESSIRYGRAAEMGGGKKGRKRVAFRSEVGGKQGDRP